MRSSAEVALFEKKQEVMDAAKKFGISSVCLHKPITEEWGENSRLLCLLISINRELFSYEQLTHSINMFRGKATQILGMPFGILPRDTIEERIGLQSNSEAKQEMQERLDYSILLSDLTDEPWLTQFENKKAASLAGSPSCSPNSLLVSSDADSPVIEEDSKFDFPIVSKEPPPFDGKKVGGSSVARGLSNNPYSSFSSKKRGSRLINVGDDENPTGRKSLKVNNDDRELPEQQPPPGKIKNT